MLGFIKRIQNNLLGTSVSSKTDVTVIITSSPVPSNPSISMIRGVMKSLALIKGLEACEIYIALDGCEQADMKAPYAKYINNLHQYAKRRKNIKLSIRKTAGHLAGNIRHCLQFVKTKYIFIVQHDFVHIQPFDIHEVIQDMDADPKLKHIRFNKRITVGKKIDKEFFGNIVQGRQYQYTQTGGWSDNNHICSASYYRDFVLRRVPDGTAMEREIYFEDIRAEVAKGTYKHDKYGTYIFGPVGHPQMILHLDGRNEVLMNMSKLQRIKSKLISIFRRFIN